MSDAQLLIDFFQNLINGAICLSIGGALLYTCTKIDAEGSARFLVGIGIVILALIGIALLFAGILLVGNALWW